MTVRTYDARWSVVTLDGQVLTEVTVKDWPNADKRLPDAIKEAAKMGGQVHWTSISVGEPQKWSQERKAKERKRRLRARMETRFPLFAEQFIETEMEKRAAYFEARDPIYDRERIGAE